MIKNIRHTGIVVDDLELESTFYRSFGFKEQSRNIEDGEFIDQLTGIESVRVEWIKLNSVSGQLIELLKYHSHPVDFQGNEQPSNYLGCSHIAFTVVDGEEACRMVCDLGGSVVNPPALSPDGKVRVAYCHDPEGVLLELVEELV